jgi:hypothetical protein
MAEWRFTRPRELLAELRKRGQVYGKSGKFPRLIALSKRSVSADLRQLPATHQITWKVDGDPTATRRFDANRRHIIIWLGN